MKNIHATAIRLDTVLQSELHSGVDNMDDYELDVEIKCYSSEEDAKELLCTLHYNLHELSLLDNGHYVNDGIYHNTFYHWENHPMMNGINHNKFYYCENHPMKGERHCWLFHCLYDHIHPDLTWEQIASIEHILY